MTFCHPVFIFFYLFPFDFVSGVLFLIAFVGSVFSVFKIIFLAWRKIPNFSNCWSFLPERTLLFHVVCVIAKKLRLREMPCTLF
uniref:Uncharacterized protein n=1 Tax=Rhizophora mucronata TaxID=61149 RepID=A0A2P2MFU8_RHIMU